MEIIAHRRNTKTLLRETPVHYGVEVDIRSQGQTLIIHHDAFAEGEDFEAWLQGYRHGTLILNVKEEGLETRLLGLMASAGIQKFFFLDQSFPFLIKTVRSGERRCALRVSEFEAIETALALAGQVDWLWIDCFNRFPLSAMQMRQLAQAGFKLCLVSPELQGRPPQDEVLRWQRWMLDEKLQVQAVCTKQPELWLSHNEVVTGCVANPTSGAHSLRLASSSNTPS